MTLGERIWKLRTQQGLSQDALAEALGVSRQSVSKWETNTSVPELEKLKKLSDLFEISLDELVRGTTPTVAQGYPQRINSCLRQIVTLYRKRAYCLGWLLVTWGVLDLLRSIQVIVQYNAHMGWESTIRFMEISCCDYVFESLKVLLGLLIVFCGRRFAGRFRWYHLGWVLVVLGIFGVRPFLRSSPLESLLVGLLMYLPFYGVERMMAHFALWPEDLGNFLCCILGLLLVYLGRKSTSKGAALK